MDTDREKFRSYVQKSGIMSALTNILVKLYEQPLKPDDPLGFIRRELEKNSDEADKIKTLEAKVSELEAQKASLEEQLRAYRDKEESCIEDKS